MKHLLKTLLLPITALTIVFAFIACDGENAPDVKYSVTYVIGEDAQGTAPEETKKAVGEKFIIKSADGITNGNLTFMGWSDGNIIYQAGEEYTMPTKAVTFTAQWEDTSCIPVTYTVTYDLNGGTGKVPTESNKEKGEKFKLASADGLKNGDLYFYGWSDGTKVYDAGAEYTMPDKAVTFTAQWDGCTEPPNEWTVTYDLNGGSGTLPTESDKIKGEKFKLASADGLKNGDKIFDGWSDGTKVYDAGAEYEMPEDHVTFTAQWKDKPVQANIIYVAYDLDFQGIISLYDNNLVVLDYIDASEESQTAVFSYTLSGTAIAITIDEDTFDGTYENELLTIQITYANTVFKFGPKEEKPKGKPTVEFSANG
ncbi:MAG: InlB B-repeat-containing protein, partial [Clostridiales bacterium]|nr:InlB B-repeat-containing protein [Clostridiales bacterium]